ncbi:MAG TPA: MarR family transcriptional regulator [Gaiellales bacterium]
MSEAADARRANLLGAAATGLSDAMAGSMAAAGGLDEAASAALVALLDFTPHGSVRALSRVVGLTHSGAVRLVDRLVDGAYVERRPGADARSLTLTLTAAGRELAERIRAVRGHALADAVASLSAGQRAVLGEICEQLVGDLTRRRLAQRERGEDPAGGALCRYCDFAACGRPQGLCPAQLAAAALRRQRPDGDPSA